MYRWPLDLPISISGNFGELRNNHFHSGLDIRTDGKEGFPVHAVADGYVSRIKISPFGYGKALYVTHNNGVVSVYAHLQSFCDTLEQYIRTQQYKEKSFEIELFPKAGQFFLGRERSWHFPATRAVPKDRTFTLNFATKKPNGH